MKTFLLTAALILPASFAGAASQADLTDQMEATITDSMTEAGYDVRNIKIEDEMFEVYAIKDGEMSEILLDDDLNVVDIKTAD